eukprot:8768669-Pyramimonas_sp.AAC.1
MMTKHFEPRNADLWKDLLEHSLIFPVTPVQCAPKTPWGPLRGPRRPDGLPHIAEPPKLDGCPEVCNILFTEKEKWGE